MRQKWIFTVCAVSLSAGIGMAGCTPAVNIPSEEGVETEDTINATSIATSEKETPESAAKTLSEEIPESVGKPQAPDNPLSEGDCSQRKTPGTGIDSELSETYLDFLKGVGTAVVADWFSPDDGYSGIHMAEAKKAYSLAQLADIVTAERYKNWESEYNGDIEYALFDSEDDREPELAVRLNSVGIDGLKDTSTTVLILKEIQENLYLCDAYDTWSRGDSIPYYYGFREDSGSAGAGDHFYKANFFSGSGKKQEIYVLESVTDWWMRYINEEAATNYDKIYNGEYPEDMEMEIYTIGGNVYYTYHTIPFRDEADREMRQTLIACFEDQGVKFLTAEEISGLIEGRSRELGIAEKWYDKKELEWRPLSDLFL